MNIILLQVLSGLKTAADSALGVAADAVPKLSDEAVNFLESVVAPKLDVPPALVDALKSENGVVETSVDAFAEAEIGFFKARIDALLVSSAAPPPAVAPVAPPVGAPLHAIDERVEIPVAEPYVPKTEPVTAAAAVQPEPEPLHRSEESA